MAIESVSDQSTIVWDSYQEHKFLFGFNNVFTIWLSSFCFVLLLAASPLASRGFALRGNFKKIKFKKKKSISGAAANNLCGVVSPEFLFFGGVRGVHPLPQENSLNPPQDQ